MATSIYRQSLALQAHIDSLGEIGADRQKTAQIGLGTINAQWDSSLTRAAHSSSAYFIADGLTTDSLIQPSKQFGEVIVKGIVPRVACIDVAERLIIALPFFNAVVLGPSQEIEPELIQYEMAEHDTLLPLETPLDRPLFTPVESLGFIMLAA